MDQGDHFSKPLCYDRGDLRLPGPLTALESKTQLRPKTKFICFLIYIYPNCVIL